jgi:hypothetical protein
MALTVEDGTGLSNADALVSLAAFKAYCDALGLSYAAYSDTELEQAIRRASLHMTNGFRWKGYPVKPRGAGNQALAWPRYDVTDEYGYSVDYTSVPPEVANATCEIALREAETPGIMTPDYTPGERVKSERFGPVSFEYDMSVAGAESSRPVLLKVRDMIGKFLDVDSGNMLAGRVLRG